MGGGLFSLVVLRRDDAAAASSTPASRAPEGSRTLVRHALTSPRIWGTSGPLDVSSSSSTGQTARSAAFRPTSHRLASAMGGFPSWGFWCCCRLVFGLRPANIASFRRWGAFQVGRQLVLILQLFAFGEFALLLRWRAFGPGGWPCRTARSAAFRPALHRPVRRWVTFLVGFFVCGSLFVAEALFLLCGF